MSNCTNTECINNLRKFENGVQKLLGRLKESEAANLELKSSIDALHMNHIKEFTTNLSKPTPTSQDFVPLLDKISSIVNVTDQSQNLPMHLFRENLNEMLQVLLKIIETKLKDSYFDHFKDYVNDLSSHLSKVDLDESGNLYESLTGANDSINLSSSLKYNDIGIDLSNEIKYLKKESAVLKEKVSYQNFLLKQLKDSLSKNGQVLNKSNETSIDSCLNNSSSNSSISFTNSRKQQKSINNYLVCPICKISADLNSINMEMFERHVKQCQPSYPVGVFCLEIFDPKDEVNFQNHIQTHLNAEEKASELKSVKTLVNLKGSLGIDDKIQDKNKLDLNKTDKTVKTENNLNTTNSTATSSENVNFIVIDKFTPKARKRL